MICPSFDRIGPAESRTSTLDFRRARFTDEHMDGKDYVKSLFPSEHPQFHSFHRVLPLQMRDTHSPLIDLKRRSADQQISQDGFSACQPSRDTEPCRRMRILTK